jgi:hypothetical protein
MERQIQVKKSFVSKLSMANTCLDVITSPEQAETFGRSSKSFKKAVAEAKVLTAAIMKAGQALDGSKGPASSDKRATKQALGDQAEFIAGSLSALAMDNDQYDLAVATDLSLTDITRGPDTDVINRCWDIHRLAEENIDLLKDDDVTVADLTGLKQCIEAFEGLQTKPRKTKVRGRAASKKLNSLFGQLTRLLTRRLDKHAAKFKTTAPEFYQAYKAARVVVGPATAKAKGKDAKADATKKAA